MHRPPGKKVGKQRVCPEWREWHAHHLGVIAQRSEAIVDVFRAVKTPLTPITGASNNVNIFRRFLQI